MESISSSIKHPKSIVAYSASVLFEKAGFYGIRSVMILYLIGETMGMDQAEAFALYGWIGLLMYIAHIPGGILGDLVIGNKKSVIIGAFLQAAGAFIMCIPVLPAFYAGLGCVILGSGLYSPNVLSEVGKTYQSRLPLMDAGFVSFYTAINIGAFLGTLLIGLLGDYSYILGFAIGGLFMLLSALFMFFIPAADAKESVNKTNSNLVLSVFSVIAAILIIGLFWMAYELASTKLFYYQYESMETMDSIWKNILRSGASTFTVFFGIIACIIWSYIYSSSLIKIVLGFFTAGIAIASTYFLADNGTDGGIYFILIIFLLLALAETLIAPVIHSVISKNVSAKYLAIVFGILFIPSRLLNYVTSKISENTMDSPLIGVNISLSIVIVIGLGLLLYWILRKTGVIQKVFNS